ncbi:MAG: lysine exporter LysO family protein [Muribaculum sp.]|nr:lysine exporter LysO family protein [Muribaculum sp.]
MGPLIILFTSILAGYLLRNRRVPQLPSSTISIVIWALLFLLGLSVGSNRNVIDHLSVYGIQALVIGSLATLGSVLAAYLLHKIASRRHRHER